MCIKLNRGYVAPETSIISVTTESGICVGSKDKVVINDNNTTTTIDKQGGGDEFTIGEWD